MAPAGPSRLPVLVEGFRVLWWGGPRVWEFLGLGFKALNLGSGFTVGLGLGIYDLGFMVENFGFGVLGSRLPVLSWNRTEADMECTVYCVI